MYILEKMRFLHRSWWQIPNDDQTGRDSRLKAEKDTTSNKNRKDLKKEKTYKSGKVDDHAGVGDLVELVERRAENVLQL